MATRRPMPEHAPEPPVAMLDFATLATDLRFDEQDTARLLRERGIDADDVRGAGQPWVTGSRQAAVGR